MRNRETVEPSPNAASPSKVAPTPPVEPEPEPDTEGEPPAPTERRRWWIWGAVAAALVLLWLLRAQLAPVLPAPVAGWLGFGKPAFMPPPRLVGVAKVVVRSAPVQVSAIGSIDPLRTVNVKSRVDGQIVAVKFKQGDAVKAGQVLFQLDDRPAQAALMQARAALDRDVATLENQKRDYVRQVQLMAAKITTQQDFDAARTAVEVTTQTIAVDGAAIENAKLTLEYNTILAPIGGRAGKVLIDLGNVVKANDTPALVTINQIQPVYVTFSVPQRYLDEVRAGVQEGARLPVIATAPGTAKVLAEGRLDFVDNAVDTTTGMIALRAIFANEDERLWPGQFVTATLVLHNEPTAMTVPPEAVQTGRDGSFVFVVQQDDTVQYRLVSVDRVVNGSAVLTKGVAQGETVVTDGQLNLVDGSPVQVARAQNTGAKDGAGKPGAGAPNGPAPAGAGQKGPAKQVTPQPSQQKTKAHIARQP